MVAKSPNETMRVHFRHCLIANIASILMMFGLALMMGYLSRRFTGEPSGSTNSDGLILFYVGASRVAFFVGLPAFVVAFIGLLKFKLWARRLYTLLMIAWGGQVVALGIVNLSLTGGLAGLFADLALLTAGAVLAMSYLTPISDLFVTSNRGVPSPTPLPSA